MSATPSDNGPGALAAKAAKAFQTSFGGVISVEPDGAAPFWVDGRGAPPKVLKAAPKTDKTTARCAWRASKDTLLRIFEGDRLLVSSYITGRLTIAGDMSIMARLQLAPPGSNSAHG